MSILKLKEVQETCVCLNYVIEAEDIHASILNGLIPVVTPHFMDAEGEPSSCGTFSFYIDLNIQDVRQKQLFVVSKAINLAKMRGFEYLYNIVISEDIHRIKILVRGV